MPDKKKYYCPDCGDELWEKEKGIFHCIECGTEKKINKSEAPPPPPE